MLKYGKFVIHKKNNSYLVVNINKPFKDGHTHVERLDVAEILCKLAYRKQLPKSRSERFLESLIRISEDKDYISKLHTLR